MRKQLSILTLATTLLLTTGSYADGYSKACDRDDRGHWSKHKSDRHHKFGKSYMNGADKITLDEFMAAKKEKFSKMDENGDGILTKDEMGYRRNRH